MQSVLLVGAGRMGGALLRGWINAVGPGFYFIALDPHARDALSDIGPDPSKGIRFSFYGAAEDLPQNLTPAAIILATKPQLVRDTVKALAGHIGPKTVLVSVAAGASIASIQDVSPPNTAIVRVMPNIGAMVGYSVSAGYASSETTEEQRDLIDHLFQSVGQMTWLNDEDALHLATALSGSGPAYYFAFCEAMIAAAEEEGLSRSTARALAIGTVTAAGQLLAATPDPGALRASVVSPNGTTAAGLDALLSDGTFTELVRKTLRAAANRSIELS